MMNNVNYNLEPLREAILEIYTVVAGICARHNLKHWAAYGTLLGAVRHGGFIPWDDDFDIHMPREDADKFIEIAKDELPAHLAIKTWKNSDFNDVFFKVQDMRTEVLDAVSKESGLILDQGIFIDIFPLDGVPDLKIVRMADTFSRLLIYTLWLRVYRKGNHSTLLGRMGAMVGRIVEVFTSRFRSRSDFLAFYDARARKYRFDKCQKCCRYYGREKGWGWEVPKKVFDETVYLPFERLQIPAPVGWDVYLRANFGDYMTFPPACRQHPSHSRVNSI